MAPNSFDNFKSDIDKIVEDMLYMTADAVMEYIEDSETIPIDTHNLKDSTGIGVYRQGVLKKFMMPRRAVRPRVIGGIDVWGSNMIDQLLEAGVQRYNDGDYIVLFSAMPYAEDVDKSIKHSGFFTVDLAGTFKNTLDEIVRIYGRKVV